MMSPNIEKYGLHRNHFNIQKFGSPEEPSFEDVQDVIVNMAQEGPSHSKPEEPLDDGRNEAIIEEIS